MRLMTAKRIPTNGTMITLFVGITRLSKRSCEMLACSSDRSPGPDLNQDHRNPGDCVRLRLEPNRSPKRDQAKVGSKDSLVILRILGGHAGAGTCPTGLMVAMQAQAHALPA